MISEQTTETISFDSTLSGTPRLDSFRLDSFRPDSFRPDSFRLDSFSLDSFCPDSLRPDSLPSAVSGGTASVQISPMGKQGEPLSRSFYRNDMVAGLSLSALLLMLFIVAQARKFLAERFSAFFFPKSSSGSDPATYRDSLLLRPALLLLIATECSLLFMGYVSRSGTAAGASFHSMPLPCAFVLVSLCFLIARLALYVLVNSIFFARSEGEHWREQYFLIMVMEGVVLLPIVLVYVFAGINDVFCYYFMIVSLLFVKILLLLKTFAVFFHKMSGLLHLIVYLCALEIVPTIAWWEAMCWIAQHTYSV